MNTHAMNSTLSNTIPSAPCFSQSSNTYTCVGNKHAFHEFLFGQKWPRSLIHRFEYGMQNIGLRFFLCDDSGSMFANDGNIVSQYG
jgi:hypothetical protein